MPKQEPEGSKYASRKWILVNKGVRLYTLIHLLNMATIQLTMHREWLPGGMVKDLWVSSLTIWSAGMLAIIGWYMKKNVDEKVLKNGSGPLG